MKKIAFVLFILCAAGSSAQESLEFSVNSGSHNRVNSPINFDLPRHLHEQSHMPYLLIEVTNGTKDTFPCQVSQGKVHFILSGETPQTTTRKFKLVRHNNQPKKHISIQMSDEKSTLLMGEKRILQYNHAITGVPDGVDKKYRRGAFIHPLWSPDGEPLTRIQPPDHYHHYGIWNPWTKTTFKGEKVDFWNLVYGQGTVHFKNYSQFFEGPVAGGLTIEKQHVVLNKKQETDPAINESLNIKAWQTNAGNSQFLLDYVVNLECASDEKIILNQYRYGGGIGYRATERWTNKNSEVLTSEGKTRKDADASKARWCIVYGESDSPSMQSGILFMSHPDNQSHPEPMRVWPFNSNNNRGDVFFEFCPIRHTAWPLYPGKQYQLKYRLVVFDGSLDADEAEQLWNDFANPPIVHLN